MKRLLLSMVFVLMGFYGFAQSEETQKGRPTQEQSNMDNSQTPTEDDPWSLFIKEVKVKGKKKWKKMQIGMDMPGQKWELTGKVVDTLGNPIEGVTVASYYYDRGDIYDAEYVTEKDGSYIIRCQLLRTNRVFKKKGYRVAGEVRPGTKVFAFHRYTVPNPIVMVPVDYKGNEAKYNEGVVCHDAISTIASLGPSESWRTYYEFEDMSFFDYIKRYNILTIKGTTMSVTRNLGKVLLVDSLDYFFEKKREARREQRVIKRSIRVYRKIQEKAAKKSGVESSERAVEIETEPETKPNVNIVMSSKNKITGRVVDENGNPIPGVMVRIQFSRSGHSDVTDDDGLFMVSSMENDFDNKLRDGDYVYFQKEGYGLKKKYYDPVSKEHKNYVYLKYDNQNPDVVMISKAAKEKQKEEKKKRK